MLKKILFLLGLALLFTSCDGEKKNEQKLPPLKAIEIPKTISGLYAGELPCDDCKKKQVKVQLDSLGEALVEEFFIQDSITKVLSKATYVDSAETVTLLFKETNKKWVFKKEGSLSLVYLDLSGKPYYMESGIAYQMLKILNKPVKK
ncbi:MAG TPA: copper resistance protein NlpE N-terminal domain-containing protein [Fibrobacteraceae bacterium]|jgi:hypothetical protein|nr:copper resistance protein NlpE [Fibrobacter sp.]HOG69367.1 copper resistance protein NlpE N-terminal domain-containing protein [Fibrobacteraceae bacterium]HPW93643.1 copper resistance protein NlpE N-terminal domain-containing protein [Fibrobacteraceae bacterium]